MIPLNWTRIGADVDGDPLRLKTTYGDIPAVVTKSRSTGLWSVVVNGRGERDVDTEEEAVTKAAEAIELIVKKRLTGAQETLALFDPQTFDDSVEALRAAAQSALYLLINQNAPPSDVPKTADSVIPALRAALKRIASTPAPAAPEPVAWVRADNRAIIWWGAAYPSHWEPGRGYAIYTDPPVSPGVAEAAERAP